LEEEGLENGARVDFYIRKGTSKHQKICPKSSSHAIQGSQFEGFSLEEEGLENGARVDMLFRALSLRASNLQLVQVLQFGF
jgi:hypothetical protein